MASQNHGAGKPQRIRQGVQGLPPAVSGGQHRAGSASAALRPPDGKGCSSQNRLRRSRPRCSVNFLLITAVPGILAGVMQVYQQVLRGVDRANQALMGGVMQLALQKLRWWLWGAWGMRNLDVVWLGWPASFVAGNHHPVLLLSEESCGKWKQNKTQSAPGKQIALRGCCVLINQLSRRLSSTALTTSSPT